MADIRVYCEYEPNESGKGKFLSRLTPALRKIGVAIQHTPKGANVALGFTRWRTEFSGLPRVLRVDGISFKKDKKDFWRSRVYHAKSIMHANAVIYQSEFSRRMVSGILDVTKARTYVIFNGDDPDCYASAATRSTTPYILSSCKWWSSRHERLQKRLGTTIEVARQFCHKHPEAQFHICGQTGKSKLPKIPGVHFHGHLNTDALVKQYQAAHAMVYLAWFDWCPNGVVEALCAGVPVLGTNGHGVEELITATNGGVVLDVDKPLKPKRVKSYKPPSIDTDYVVSQLEQMLEQRIIPNTASIDINTIARQYKAVFEGLL